MYARFARSIREPDGRHAPRDMSIRHVPVLVVGGGPIGLTGSNLLSHHGVEHLLAQARYLSKRCHTSCVTSARCAPDVGAVGERPQYRLMNRG